MELFLQILAYILACGALSFLIATQVWYIMFAIGQPDPNDEDEPVYNGRIFSKFGRWIVKKHNQKNKLGHAPFWVDAFLCPICLTFWVSLANCLVLVWALSLPCGYIGLSFPISTLGAFFYRRFLP